MPRPKEDRTQIIARVGEATPKKIKAYAKAHGCEYAGDGSIGKLLDAIAEGRIVLIKSPLAVDE